MAVTAVGIIRAGKHLIHIPLRPRRGRFFDPPYPSRGVETVLTLASKRLGH